MELITENRKTWLKSFMPDGYQNFGQGCRQRVLQQWEGRVGESYVVFVVKLCSLIFENISLDFLKETVKKMYTLMFSLTPEIVINNNFNKSKVISDIYILFTISF
ncbi:hypothetical protein J6590_010322 [Homalodisca vitripennis]|nr:hypothetical protein J6590_010322 [Homalodisca vitripennis]